MMDIYDVLLRMSARLDEITAKVGAGGATPREREDQTLRRLARELDDAVATILDERHVVGARDESL